MCIRDREGIVKGYLGEGDRSDRFVGTGFPGAGTGCAGQDKKAGKAKDFFHRGKDSFSKMAIFLLPSKFRPGRNDLVT